MKTRAFSITKKEAGQIAKPSMFKIAQEIIQRTVLDYDNMQFIANGDDTLIMGIKTNQFPNDFLEAVKQVANFYNMRLWLSRGLYLGEEFNFELQIYRY
jgi:hypothetical protein